MKDVLDNLLADFNRSDSQSKVYVRNDCLFVCAGFQNLEQEELELIRERQFQWKVLRIAQTSYLCFSPTGYSWNEIALQNADRSQELENLLAYRKKTIPIRFIGLKDSSGEIFTDRDFTLDETQTEKLLSAVKSQQYITQKQEEDLNFLGDPAPLVKAMQLGDLPDILGVDVNKAEHSVHFTVNTMPARELKEPRARWILRHFEKLWGFEKMQAFSRMLENMAYEKVEREWKYCLIPVDIFQEIEDISNRENMQSQLKNLGFEHLIPEYLDKLPNTYYSSIYAALMFNWRYSKGIYNFDDDVLKSIYLASLPVHINARIFTRLPEYCVYVKTPEMSDWNGRPMQGFFAMAEEVPVNEELADFINENYEFDEDSEPLETDASLYLLIDGGSSDASRDGRTNVVKIPIDLGKIEECLELIELVEPRPDERDPETEELVDWASPLLNQLLYLCSEEPEIQHARQPELKPETEDVKKTKRGLKLYTPSRVNEWLCGWRTGSFVKQQKESEKQEARPDEDMRTVRKHLRRAHWHTFYAGKRDAPEREVRIKWLQMIKVNFDDEDTTKLPTVVKRVK